MGTTGERGGIRVHWDTREAARFYREGRWASEGKRARDPRLVDRILRRHLAATEHALVLDAPCGAGRLAGVLATHGRYVGLDLSPAMLAEARSAGVSGTLLSGEIDRLPFADGSFDAVVACRLLHHVREPERVAAVLRELCRVSRGLVVASFWDDAALPSWRRRTFPEARVARRFTHAKSVLAQAVASAGAEVLEWRHTLRFLSRQAFLVARKRRRAGP